MSNCKSINIIGYNINTANKILTITSDMLCTNYFAIKQS